jgi:hypothetical protein
VSVQRLCRAGSRARGHYEWSDRAVTFDSSSIATRSCKVINSSRELRFF